jgi:hypothetical protein
MDLAIHPDSCELHIDSQKPKSKALHEDKQEFKRPITHTCKLVAIKNLFNFSELFVCTAIKIIGLRSQLFCTYNRKLKGHS